MRHLLALLVALLPAVASADERRAVALFPLDGPPGREGATVASAAGDLIADALSRTAGLALVDRENIDAVLREQRVSGLAGGSEPAKIGHLLRATHAVSGAVARTEGGWRFTLSVLTVPEGVVLGSVDAVGDDRDLAATAERAAGGLVAVLSAAIPPRSLREDARAGASLHYLRGIGFLRASLFPEAIGEFLEARRRSVRFPETRFWMGKAYLESGAPDHAALALREFLAEGADPDLDPDARALLARAEAPRPTPPRASLPPSLAETLSSTDDPSARAAAIEAAIARGREGAAELAAAADLPPRVEEVRAILDGLATVDADRFVALLAGKPHLLDFTTSFRSTFTPDRAARFARGLLSPLPAARDPVGRLLAAALVFHRGPQSRVEPAAAEAVWVVVREAAASADPAVSLTAIRLFPGDADVLTVVGKRVLDPAFDAGYRADALLAVEPRALYSDALCDAVLTLLADPHPGLRRAALQVAHGWHVDRTGNWREREAPFRARVSAKAMEILVSRRFPDEAAALSWVFRGEPTLPDLAFLDELLRSSHASERVAGLRLCGWHPADRGRVAFAFLDDPAPEVRSEALGRVGGSADPGTSFRDLIAWWRRKLATESVPGGIPPPDPRAVCRALGHLALRARPGRPAAPTDLDGPDAWEAWFAK